MKILSFGGGRRMRECERLLSELTAGLSGRIVLLPIPTSRDKTYITSTDIPISALRRELQEGDLLVGYNIPKELLVEGISVYDASLDERFLYENALISARGALGYLLTNFTKDIADMRLALVGYGRIGKALLRYLLALGADPLVLTRRREIALELGSMGVRCAVIGEDTDLSGLDILINTAPARQIEEESLDEKTKILDLASGNIFNESKRLTKLASIPDAYYPLTAGRLYAEGVLRHLDMEVSL
jgi:hypothetical protein